MKILTFLDFLLRKGILMMGSCSTLNAPSGSTWRTSFTERKDVFSWYNKLAKIIFDRL